MKNNKILLINDDGINSPGLLAAVQVGIEFGDVIVAAPSTQQTAMGRSLKGNRNALLQPIDYEVYGKKIEAYQCECSPALLVRHSLAVLFPFEKPDLIISGINYGENIGATITSSGTVGAALEGATFGIPSIAISKETDIESHHNYTKQDWTGTQYFLRYFVKRMLMEKLPFDVDVLKVDVPDTADSSTPWEITKQAKTPYYSTVFKNPSLKSRLGDGKTAIDLDSESLETGTDIHAIYVDRTVSVTPISISLTSRVDFQELNNLLKRT